ncbi:MAG: hypothetical protein M0R73_10115 [Dehalococcoidia bacterium]|nr:hypothetical protein [Dehalococcoidia bacterium]
MLLTMVLGITIGALGLVLLRQFLEGSFEEHGAPILSPASFPRLAPPTRVRTPYRRALPPLPSHPTARGLSARRAA